MDDEQLSTLRKKIDKINYRILDLLCQRGEIVAQIAGIHATRDEVFFHPEREAQMLEDLIARNRGPYANETIAYLFKEIFKASFDLQQQQRLRGLLCHRESRPDAGPIVVHGHTMGGGGFAIIAGPCSVESLEQLSTVANALSNCGVGFLRGGAYKPRTSPYSFQGLKETGLKYMSEVGQRFKLVTVSEIMDPRDLDFFEQYIDVLQIGTRNMYNTPLLTAVGRTGKPVLLKRGFMATLEEFLLATEYIMLQGNTNIILCERGIRTYEPWTRNTVDLAGVAILKQETYLPVIVDISHSVGRRDIAIPLALAARAIGADGIMVEVHPTPAVALSDNRQQLDLQQFEQLVTALQS
jgi:3-deoxy-7-phosphoheptulonate synthase/chorismate mutase